MLNHEIEGRKISINCDSQSSTRAIDSTVIKTKTIGNAKFALESLGAVNEVTLRWIPAHSGFEGNELADQLARQGSNNESAIRFQYRVVFALKGKVCKRNDPDETARHPSGHTDSDWSCVSQLSSL